VKRRLLLATAVAGWAAIVGVGMVALARYKSTPGVEAHAPASWPADSAIPRGDGRATLVMFAHPHCTCTRASMNELAKLLTRVGDRVAARVVFLHPDGVGEDWDRSELVARAREIAGVEVLLDHDGAEARRFGTATSGQVLLYGTDGHLEFSGGITASRGHEGDSVGEERIEQLLAGGPVALSTAPVFGCGLEERKERTP
jgi:hypothetical protein